jgi:hypothetical protein
MMADEADNRARRRDKPKSRRVGHVLERGPNMWLIRVFMGYELNGVNGYFNKMFHGAKKTGK